jgi:hypothetical protein
MFPAMFGGFLAAHLAIKGWMPLLALSAACSHAGARPDAAGRGV